MRLIVGYEILKNELQATMQTTREEQMIIGSEIIAVWEYFQRIYQLNIQLKIDFTWVGQ